MGSVIDWSKNDHPMTTGARPFGILGLMNKPSLAFCAVLLLSLCSLAGAAPATTTAEGKDPAELLRQGLFEEEANRDLGKAAAAYAGVVELYDAQRTLAVTAMFRLAEVRAAQGNKVEATSLYQRVLTEFPNQDPLAKLSRERLVALGAPTSAPGGPPPTSADDEEGKMLAQYEAQPHLHDYDSVVDEVPYNGTTPMIYASGKGWTRLLTLMLDHDGHVGGYGYGGEPLRAAAASGQKEAVALLLSRGAQVDREGAYGWTALHAACLGRHAEVVSLLLDKGANPDVYCSNKPDPKRIPVHAWGPALPKFLPAWKDIPLGTPLLIAIRNGDTDVLTRLLDHHADPNFYDSPGANDTAKSSPLIFALRIGQGAAAQLLIDHGAKTNFATPEGFTVLHAAAAGTPTLVPILLEKGLPQTVDSNGWTPLFYSVYLGGSRHNFNEAKGEENLTPLPEFMNRFIAYTAAWDALLAHGADPNARDHADCTLLHYSVPDDYHPTEVPGWLVAHGADINARGPRGQTPLMRFCDSHAMNWQDSKQNREAVYGANWFMEHGADANAKDDAGQTPLMLWRGSEGRALARKYVLPALIGKSLGARAVTALVDGGSAALESQQVEPLAEFDLPPSLLLLMKLALANSYYPHLAIDIHHAGPDGKETGVDRVNIDFSAKEVDISKWPTLRWGDVVVFSSDNYASGNLEEPYQHLTAGMTRTVALEIGDQTTTLVLADPVTDSMAFGSLIMKRLAETAAQPLRSPPLVRTSATPTPEHDPRLHTEPDGLLAWTPTVKTLPGWTLSELVLHLTQADPCARLDLVHLYRTVNGQPHDWPLDLRAGSAAEAETYWDGRPSSVKRVPVWLADGDRLVIPRRPATDAEALAARRKTICFEAPGGLFVQPVFTRVSDDPAPHTLGELLMQAYLSPMLIPYPNLSKIVIHRLTGNGAEEEHKPVDLTQTILTSQTLHNDEALRKSDLPLQWGDRVEISAIEVADLLKWKELSPATEEYLNNVLTHPVFVTLNGQPTMDVGESSGNWLKPVFKPYVALDWTFPVRFEQHERGETGTFTALTLLRQMQINLDTMTRFTLRNGDGVHDYDLKTLHEVNPWLGFGSRVNVQQLSP